MPVIDPYPTPLFHGPRWTRFHEPAIDYALQIGTPYKDKSTDRWLQAETRVRLFIFEYSVIPLIESAILDDHNDSAFDGTYGFDFYHPRTGVVYENTHYEKYERPAHEKYWIQRRMVTLKWVG